MNIKFNKEDEKYALDILKAVGSRDKVKSMEAQVSLAALVGPVVQTVLEQAANSNLIYQTKTYTLGETPSIPVDLYFDNDEGLLDVWSNSIAGGLPSNMVWGSDEYRFTTWQIASAVHFLKAYAEKSRGGLDVVAKAIRRLSQEVLGKQEYQLWSIVLTALAQARTAGDTHLITAASAGKIGPDDLNSLWTLVKRLRRSWIGGTPTAAYGRGLTDMFISIEVQESIRSMAYNPVNTVAGVTDTTGTEVGSTVGIPLPDAMRLQIFNNGGVSELFGVRIHELQELGVGEAYNDIFDAGYSPGGGDPTFDAATQEIALGFDLSVDSAVKVVAADGDSDATFRVEPDDQWVSRSKKIGWWGEAEMGAIVVDNKAFCGLIL